ncbi:hypothetical protein [Spirosoma jeollabukense]
MVYVYGQTLSMVIWVSWFSPYLSDSIGNCHSRKSGNTFRGTSTRIGLDELAPRDFQLLPVDPPGIIGTEEGQ